MGNFKILQYNMQFGQTWDDARPDDIGISVSYPLPGTRFHSRVKGEMDKATHWRDSSDLAMLFRGRHGTTYYRWLHSYAHARFRLALALRTHEGTLPRRLFNTIRYGAKRAVAGFALALSARDRLQVRSFSPELSRERAGRPAAPGLISPSEPR